MQTRQIGPLRVSAIGLGCMGMTLVYGEPDQGECIATVHRAIELGVTFIDTADVYGDGRSERLIGQLLRDRPDADLTVATKMGRRVEQVPSAYNLDAFRAWNDRSRENLGVDTLDLVQLHSPPTEVYSTDAVFDALDLMVQEQRIAAYGVSVETSAQALSAIARPNLASVQIILNAFRLKPLDQVLPAAREVGVGIIARVPLASGLLSGKYDENTTFGPDDHRTFNRRGEAFDVGETFSGVDFATGLEAVRRLRPLAPEGATMAQFALRWIIDQPGVSVVIPGARNPEQVAGNVAAAALARLPQDTLVGVRAVYDELIRPQIHDRW
jgi:aryl-alcohol dehydrogenase-like predicted oxidoreductase